MELLGQRYHGKLDEKADRWIGFAVSGVVRMKQLINDLLEFSRVGTRGKPFAPTDCGAVVHTVMQNLHQAIQDSGATVICSALPTLKADTSQLTQVFQNLIGNAIKFRGSQPPEVHVEAQRQEGGWQLSVRDNGIGIDPQFAERIFVIFQRLHTHVEYPGTGIGLALCRKVIERHGGTIWLESQPGKGATFFFTIPDIAPITPGEVS
jgi:light-regulated signal transduction histidine kinase (bacteriophytochrome)